MDKRRHELKELKSYTNYVEKEVTLLLQNLQWDPKHTTEKRAMVTCRHNSNHRIPLEDRDTHENQCYLKMLGYHKEDTFLPDPVDPDAKTLVKFTTQDIANIIKNAGIKNSSFQRGCGGPEPLTVERLQREYSAEERRAIHDAVVSAAPLVHDLAELELLSLNNGGTGREKSRLEILSELRNMKRRRTKYRVAATTRNYSDVLRDVIKTQMESYGEATKTIIKTEYGPNVYVSQKATNIQSKTNPQSVTINRKSLEPTDKQSNSNPRERYRTDPSEKDDNRRHYNTEHSSNERRNNRHNTYQSEERHVNSERRHYTRDKHMTNEINKTYNESRSRERYNDDTYHKNRGRQYETYNRNKHEVVIKQERESQESKSYSNYNRDHSRDRHRERSRSKEKRRDSERAYKDKHNKEKYEEHGKRQKNNEICSDAIVKQEINAHDSHDDNNGEGYSKCHRERSRSKEKRHKHKKKHQRDKSSSRKHKHSKRKREYSPDVVVKQERISP